jgi:SAM-dependent methyltransferase
MKKQPETYEDLDWAQLRANAMAKKGWKSKTPTDWDQKAKSFSGRNKDSSYVDLFCQHLPLTPATTVLDVGSGPGTLALPMARKAKAVTALDFSPGMLEILQGLADEENLTNITSLCCAWEDDWDEKGVGQHELVVASRSVGVADLYTAIKKLERHATKAIYITDRIGSTPFDAGAFAAVGRSFLPGPDYIYTLNILYTLGIHPEVRTIELDPVNRYRSEEDAYNGFAWMFQDLTSTEERTLRDYVKTRIEGREGDWLLVRRSTTVRWALISWKVREDADNAR